LPEIVCLSIYTCVKVLSLTLLPLYAAPQERKGNCFQEQRYKVTYVTVSRFRWERGEKGFNNLNRSNVSKALLLCNKTPGWSISG